MAFSIPLNQLYTAELRIQGTVSAAGSNSRTAMQVHHYRRTANVLTVNKANIITAFLAACRSALTACLSVRYTGTVTDCRMIEDALDQPLPMAETHVGGVAGDSMPMSVSAFLKYSTGLRGKSFRGSKRVYPIAESFTTVATDDILNAGALALFATLNTALLAGFTDGDGNVWVPCILSRLNSQLKKNPTTVFRNDVTSITTRKSLGHMRHRQAKSLY
jgi:hypothetical protein